MTHLITQAIRIVIAIIKFLYKKIGINGILVVILLVGSPTASIYCNTQMNNYRHEQNYTLKEVVSFEKISSKDALLEKNDIEIVGDEVAYLAVLKVDNLYSTEVISWNIKARNQKKSEIQCYELGYYPNILDDGVVIPAGTSGYLSYVIVLDKEKVEKTTSITFYEWDVYESEPSNLVTLHLLS